MSLLATESQTPLYIAGIGAMGGALAVFMGQGKADIRLIFKDQARLASYQHCKLTAIYDHQEITAQPLAISLDTLGQEPIHYLLCCVKAYDVTRFLMRIKDNLTENSIVILSHNGLGVIDEIKQLLPQLRIVFAICTIGAYLEKPFKIRVFLDGNIYLGGVIGQFSEQEKKMICLSFQEANLPYQWDEAIQSRMWEKFALNCSINILTALYSCKNGALLEHFDVLEKLTKEVSLVLQAQGVAITAADLLLKVIKVIKGTAENYSSMYQDVLDHKLTELHYLNEELVKLALEKKIATPFNIELLKQFYLKFPTFL